MLNKRILRVVLTMAEGHDVTLNESLDIKVQTSKLALGTQATASIQIIGLAESLRAQLLSRINLYQNNLTQKFGTGNPFIPVKVIAGYTTTGGENTRTIFNGEAFTSRPTSAPPNVGIQIIAATHQVDKTNIPTAYPPSQMTYAAAAQWVADQVGIPLQFSASCGPQIVTNAFVTPTTIGQLPKMLIAIAPYSNPVDVFIDNETLVVRDRNGALQGRSPITIDEFIGIPGWTEYGCEFRSLFRTDIDMHTPLTIKSSLNPSLNNSFVPYRIAHDLTSRDVPFYINVAAAVPANKILSGG